MSRKILYLFFGLLFVSDLLLAQSGFSDFNKFILDSLIRKSELRFNSTEEEATFRKFEKTNKIDDGFRLIFSSVSQLENAENALKLLHKEKVLLKTKISKMSDIKKVNYLSKHISTNFLDKLAPYSFLPNIFVDKTFDQISASLIYAWFFEHLNIPYEARISSVNAYLVAYPRTLSIVVEPVKLSSNIQIYNESFKTNYVNELRELKLISADEINNETIAELFNKYFFVEYKSDYQGLIAAHFQNLAYYNIDYYYRLENAFFYYLISMSLFPNNNAIYSMLNVGKNYLMLETNKNPLTVAYAIGILSRCNEGLVKSKVISVVYEDLSKDFIKSKNLELYDSTYNLLQSLIYDEKISTQIRNMYLKTKILYEVEIKNYQKAYNLAVEFLKLDIESKEILDYVSDFFMYYSLFVENIEDKAETIEKLNNLMSIAPELEKYYLPQFQRVNYYCILAENAFNKGDIEKGNHYLDIIEGINVGNGFTFEQLIVNVYVSASFWFYKKHNNKLAKQYINRGLAKYPNNNELLRRLRAF